MSKQKPENIYKIYLQNLSNYMAIQKTMQTSAQSFSDDLLG